MGAEIEWHAFDIGDGLAPPEFARLVRVASSITFEGKSKIAFEPGGQVELITPPVRGVAASVAVASRDLDTLRRALAAEGIVLYGAGTGVMPVGRVLDQPRYSAMEAYFEADGGAGREMMLSTASLQVNLDIGEPDEVADRWSTANMIGPVLAAAFANSPRAHWKSYRLAIWSMIDSSRTSTPKLDVDPVRAWLDYALDARVMLIRIDPTTYVPAESSLRFVDWMSHGSDYGYPTLDDFRYHMTTLFPPVRPRGCLELRMLDALPDPWWQVAIAVSAVLLDDDDARPRAFAACSGTESMWAEAAEFGMSHPALWRAANECFEIAIEAMSWRQECDELARLTEEYMDRFVYRGRSPADTEAKDHHVYRFPAAVGA